MSDRLVRQARGCITRHDRGAALAPGQQPVAGADIEPGHLGLAVARGTVLQQNFHRSGRCVGLRCREREHGCQRCNQ